MFRSAKAEAKKAQRRDCGFKKNETPNRSSQSMTKGQKTLTEMMKKKRLTPVSSNEILGKGNKHYDEENHEESLEENEQ